MADVEPSVSVLVREYVEIKYAASPAGSNKVIFPLSETQDVLVDLAQLLKHDAPPVKVIGPGGTQV